MLEETLPTIADQELEEFFQITHTVHGFDFREYARASLLRRLGTFLKKYAVSSLSALNHRLLQQKEFFEVLLSEITVSTTELFRDPAAWVAFRKQALVYFLTLPQLRIWHAGASTGEEVLSMAILLKESGLYEKATLYATDIDMRSLSIAAKARYPLRNRKAFEQNLSQVLPNVSLETYMQVEGNEMVFDPSLLKRVTFMRHNLVNDEPFMSFEVIFCRNVLIYFTPELQGRVISKLLRALVAGGVLVIGTKESLFWSQEANEKLVPINHLERIYRKQR